MEVIVAEFLDELERSADESRIRRQQRLADERRWAEERRLRDEEERRARELDDHLKLYRGARDLREYLALAESVEKAAPDTDGIEWVKRRLETYEAMLRGRVTKSAATR